MSDPSASSFDQNLSQLRQVMMARAPGPGSYATCVPGFMINRRDVPNIAEVCFNKPIAAATIQGAKRTVVGTQEFRYGTGHCLVAGVDLPSMSHITDASPDKPYLVLSLELDPAVISDLAARMPLPDKRSPGLCSAGASVAPLDTATLSAFLRLLQVSEKPDQAAVLAPLILREIHFRLLCGPQGAVLRALNTHGTHSNRVFTAINWLRANFREGLHVDDLARLVHMAPPTFRRHFKTVTTMNPTRYHQHLRLYEAQRLMLAERCDALEAGYAVGYESPTQFNREYKRLFGEPPGRNISHVRYG